MEQQTKNLAYGIGQLLDNKKGQDILIIDIHEFSVIADYFIICSGRSSVQVRALCDEIQEKLGKQGISPKHTEGYQQGKWIVIDYGDIIVHIFHEEQRKFYDLERLWNNGDNVCSIAAEN